MAGHTVGENGFIWIPMIVFESNFSVLAILFPIQLRFPLSINKVPEQSFKGVDLNFGTQCFVHSQLFASCSRVGDKNNLLTITLDSKARNTVYFEAFHNYQVHLQVVRSYIATWRECY